MSKKALLTIALGGLLVMALFGCRTPASPTAAAGAAFNIRDFGATGVKEDLAQESIQQAVDASSSNILP